MTEVAVKTYPVMEVFGPVVQGEGPLAGQVTHFVRFGLCDYRCSWCDSMFAVEPEEVKAHAERLDVSSIVERLEWLDLAPWVTLSGGNPAVHDLGPLVKELRETLGLDVAVETQGSRWRDWLADVDLLIVSPKPPSSGMVNEKYSQQTATFMDKAMFRLN
jgi:7-carboxy-7-deazaguanine synthase